jgi:hypothetical protein
VDRHGLGFPDAVLIDDRADNCAAFTACGSAAIRRLTASLARSWIFGLCELSRNERS